MKISCWQLVNGNETDIARLFFDTSDVATMLYCGPVNEYY